MNELPVGGWGIRGTWHGKIGATQFQIHKMVLVCCPICTSDSSLSGHTITDEGVVSPVFYCPYGCGFRSTLKLAGYPDFLRQAYPPSPAES